MMMVGPRNSLVSRLLGGDYDPLTDTSPWMLWSGYWQDLPELWVDKIHDHVGEECED